MAVQVVVDAHTHFLPRELVHATSFTGADLPYTVSFLDDAGGVIFSKQGRADGFEVAQLVDPRRRIRDMDQLGVDRQVLSVPPPFGFFNTQEVGLGLRLCRELNDRIAAVVSAHSERFFGLATVPLLDPELAATELTRAVTELGLHGVQIPTRVGERNLDRPGLRTFYETAERLGATVFVHSTRGFEAERLAGYHLGNLIGNPTEDAIAAASLIFGGVIDAFPRLKLYVAHGGGSCPYLAGRWDRGWQVRPEAHGSISSPPSSYLRRLSFDSLTHAEPSLRYLLEVSGAGQVLLGTDYPYDMREPDPIGAISRITDLSEEDRDRVLGGNALAMFGAGKPT